MTPEERNLITGLFDRMRGMGSIEKERDAEALINTEVRRIPDSAYMLVQSVLVNEQALAGAQDRIEQLEARIAQLESGRGAQQSSGGGFLGGLFGGGKAQPTSVPVSRSQPPANSPWGPAPGSAAPQYQQAPMQQAAPQRSGGGFMAQAMTTAAGVAGGMLAANAISNMMRGNSGSSQSGYDQAAADRAQDTQQDQEFAQQDALDSNNDQGSYTADSGGGWGGGDGADT